MYWCDSGTLNSSLEKRIETFEMHLYSRMLRITWIERVTNPEVRNRMQKNKKLVLTVKERKLEGTLKSSQNHCCTIHKKKEDGKSENNTDIWRI